MKFDKENLLKQLAYFSVLLVFASFIYRAYSTPNPDDIKGIWIIEDGSAKVKIDNCSNKYCGEIVWLKEQSKNGKEILDVNNKETGKRTRKVLGLGIITNLKADEKGWSGGKLYAPKLGSTFDLTIKQIDKNKLEIKANYGFIGKSETWIRSN